MPVGSMFLRTIAVSSLLLTVNVSAQTPAPPDDNEESAGALEEIIVTARKREESFIDVPVIATVLAGEILDDYSIDDLYSVVHFAPGLVIGDSLAANGVQISLRGVGNTANNATLDQSVSLNVDGIQLTQGLSYNLGLFDVAQVEVLKGPQSLFFGKNSPAGVISLRSNDPGDELEFFARVGYEFEAEEKIGEFIVSGPLSDTFGLRLAARYSEENGYFRNYPDADETWGGRNPDPKFTPRSDLILRGTAVFEPNDIYYARLKLNYQSLRVDGQTPATQLGYCPEGTATVPPLNLPFIGAEDCTVDRNLHMAYPVAAAFPTARNNAEPFFDLDQTLFSLEQTFMLPSDLALTSLTGWYDMSQEYLFIAATSSLTPALLADSNFYSDQFTQEFRLASDWSDSFNFMAGVFYQDASMNPQVYLPANQLFGFPEAFMRVNHDIGIESFSVFGQILYDFSDQWELSVGGRWTSEERTDKQTNLITGTPTPAPLFTEEIDSDNFSPEVTLSYKPTDDMTWFAAYKTGYKSGSFNGIIFQTPTTPNSFDDEEAEGVEVGVKALFMDRQLFLNAAAYFYEYTDLQVGANEIDGQSGLIALRTLNAAEAEVYGVDIELSYSPDSLEGLNLHGGVNYNHSRFTSYKNAPCGNGQTIAEGCDQLLDPNTGRYTSQDLTGHALVRAPDWIAYARFDYEIPLSDSQSLTFGSHVRYSSEYVTNSADLFGFPQEAYTKWDAFLTYRGANDAWDISLIGNNLSDKVITSNCFNSNSQNGVFFGGQISGADQPGPAGGDEANCVSETGREVWIRVSAWF